MSLKIIIKYKSRSRIFFTLYVKKKKILEKWNISFGKRKLFENII